MTFGSLLSVEGAARLFSLGAPVYSHRRFEPGGKVPFYQSPEDLYLYQPNSRFSSVYDVAGDARGYFKPDGRVEYEINSLGFRGPPIVEFKPASALRIICLGDSFTFGEGVRYRDTYPARLQQLLAANPKLGKVEVINAGVQGFGTIEEVKLYESRCSSLSPDVVVLQFFLNDAKPFAETIRLNKAQTSSMPLSPMGRISRVWEICERRTQAKLFQEQYFRAIRDSFESPRWRESKSAIGQLATRAKQDHFRLLVVVFPVLWGLESVYPFSDEHALVQRVCEQASCECLDLLDTFRPRRSEELWVHPTDQHPNEIAHGLAAEAIAARLSSPPG
jgi:hypothetical protein